MKKILNKRSGLKIALTIISFLLIQNGYSQNQYDKIPEFDSTIYTEPMFIALMSSAILLLILILVLASILRASLEYRKIMEEKKEKKNNNGTPALPLILFLLFFPSFLFAQDKMTTASGKPIPPFPTDWYGMDGLTFWTLVLFIAFELAVVIFFLNQIRLLIGNKKQVEARKKKITISILDKLNASVSVEEEKDILLDHNYDGIRELDNDLPPWWKYGFYLTIVIALVYMTHYHVTKTGMSQLEEYENEMYQASMQIEEYRKKAANLVDENNVTLLDDEPALREGKGVYDANCLACHGASGEGGVGPNLTDDYWLHGGSIQDIFKSIKYGWPEKGMKSWQAELNSRQMHTVASYIKSLRGSNPANAKESQGDLYVEDGTTMVTDSLPVNDTLNPMTPALEK